MKNFDDQYVLLEELYEDTYYPDFLVDRIKTYLLDFINYLETEPKILKEIEDKIYELVLNVQNLQYDFLDNHSELDTLARECLTRDLEYIIKWFKLPINIEAVLAEREWE